MEEQNKDEEGTVQLQRKRRKKTKYEKVEQASERSACRIFKSTSGSPMRNGAYLSVYGQGVINVVGVAGV
jgi:hypothetical protein